MLDVSIFPVHQTHDMTHISEPLFHDNYYAVLGVSPTATTEEIKQKYHQIAKTNHPDLPKNRGNEELRKNFAAVTEAYDVFVE